MGPGSVDKKNNNLQIWGNEKTMNLNSLILTNIQSSHYFKVNLYQLKTYHEVIDEIYYKVNHLEPWEKGSRKTAGQTGMCGGVRGVGAGGIVSTAFCILYKFFTLKLTRKQLVGLITHADSPYIRALGFMYIRFTQPPAHLWDWYEEYLTDTEEIDVRAGGGQMMTIGEMLQHFLSKLEWFATLFPRIPVPIQKDIEKKLGEWQSRPENKAFVITSGQQAVKQQTDMLRSHDSRTGQSRDTQQVSSHHSSERQRRHSRSPSRSSASRRGRDDKHRHSRDDRGHDSSRRHRSSRERRLHRSDDRHSKERSHGRGHRRSDRRRE